MSGISKTVGRRQVRYESLAEFMAEVELLAAGPVHTVGNWTYPQILQHLAATIGCSLDGFPFRAPWFVRHLIAPFLKNRFITQTMRAGFNLPKSAHALLPSPEISLPESLVNLRRQVSRLGADERDRAPHPFLGRLAAQEWNSVHLRHAELHMSFVVPISAGTR